MNRHICFKLLTFTLLSVLVPNISLAAPRAMLEKGQAFTLDNQVRAFQIPTEDSSGKIHFYDMTITLTVNDDGSLSPIAEVTANPSPSIKTRVLVPGTYKSTDGSVICNITNLTLTDGRIQSILTCPPTASEFGLSVVTGKIAKGHPFLAELTAAEIPKRSDMGTQTWGVVTNGHFHVGSCGSETSSYYEANTPIGAKTDGNTLILSVYVKYGYTNSGSFICSSTFIKQP